MRLPRERGNSLPNPAGRNMSPCRTTGRLRRLRFAHSRLPSGTEGHSVTTTKSHESEQPVSQKAISADADFWIRQFIEHLELHFLDASRDLPPDADYSELQLATARAILGTYLDSGMELQSVMELFGQVAVEWRSVGVAWSDALNQRRFALIDKENRRVADTRREHRACGSDKNHARPRRVGGESANRGGTGPASEAAAT